jgi:hypothetical protein
MPEELAGQTTVSNGDTMWIYDPVNDQVTVMEIAELSNDISEIDYASAIGRILNETDVSLLGMETIDERDTFILLLVPKENESLYGSGMKVWVDEDTWTPLKIEMGTEETYQIVIEYSDFEVNTGISDDEFEFEIPEGAKVIEFDDLEDLLPVKMTLDEVQDISEFEILVPSYVPVGYELDHLTYSDNSLVSNLKESVTFLYSNDEERILVSENFYEGEKDANSFSIMESEIVYVNGEEADLYSMYGGSLMLQWETDDAIISISGSLERDEIIKIAESMK